MALGLVAGLAGQTVKLGADAVVQRDVGESVRTRVFAWQETTLQMAWVVGGGIGIALPLVPCWVSVWCPPCWWWCCW